MSADSPSRLTLERSPGTVPNRAADDAAKNRIEGRFPHGTEFSPQVLHD
jgi:hypothetical protein